MTTDRAAIAIVGAGPRGTGMLERIAASVPELLPRVGALDVHLIRPLPGGCRPDLAAPSSRRCSP